MLPALKFLPGPRVPTALLAGWKAGSQSWGFQHPRSPRPVTQPLLLLPLHELEQGVMMRPQDLSRCWTSAKSKEVAPKFVSKGCQSCLS